MDLSLIYPMNNEEENVGYLLERTISTLNQYYSDKNNYEIICINDNSQDGTLLILEEYAKKTPQIRIISFNKRIGHAQALAKGFENMNTSKYVIICDADLQYLPEEIPLFLSYARDNPDISIINAWRVEKYEPFLKLFASKVYNYLMRKFFDTTLHDHASTFTLYKSEQVRNMNLINNDQRYLIPMVKYKWNLTNREIYEMKVTHQPRKFGKSKYPTWKKIFFGFFEIIQKKNDLKRNKNK